MNKTFSSYFEFLQQASRKLKPDFFFIISSSQARLRCKALLEVKENKNLEGTQSQTGNKGYTSTLIQKTRNMNQTINKPILN